MPKKVDHDRQREIFAKAAYRVLARKGLADTTLRDVADEAGFTTGALAHYVRDKDALLLEALHYMSNEVLLLRVREEEYHDIEAFRRVLLNALPLTAQRKAFCRVTFNFWQRAQQDKKLRAMMRDSYAEWQNYLARFLRVLKEDGEIPQDINPQQMALGALALVDGITARILSSRFAATPQKSRDLVDAWLRTMLGYGEGPPKALKRPTAAKKRRK